MSVLIYKIDSSKLVPVGQDGYQKGQEQAKVYFDEVPRDDFAVAITGDEHIRKIALMADLDLRGNNRILISVDNEDAQRVGMTIYYYDVEREAARHCTVSHANCEAESNYELANQILGYIEDAFYAQADKKIGMQQPYVDDLISNAAQRSELCNEGKPTPELGETKLM